MVLDEFDGASIDNIFHQSGQFIPWWSQDSFLFTFLYLKKTLNVLFSLESSSILHLSFIFNVQKLFIALVFIFQLFCSAIGGVVHHIDLRMDYQQIDKFQKSFEFLLLNS